MVPLTSQSIARWRLATVVAIFRQPPFQFCQTGLQVADLLPQCGILRLQLSYSFFLSHSLILADLVISFLSSYPESSKALRNSMPIHNLPDL